MSFRTRLALVAAAAVGIAVVAASVVVYVVVRDQLLGQVDRALERRAVDLTTGREPHPEGGFLNVPGARLGVESDSVQAVLPTGEAMVEPGAAFALPADRRAREAAHGGGDIYFSNRHYRGVEFRVLTIPGSPFAIQIIRPLNEVNRTLHRITIFLIIIAAGGVGVAAALGLLVSRAALALVSSVTITTEAVTEARVLSQRIE